MKMANNLRRIMNEKRISVSELSEKVHIPQKTIYHWLSGQRPRDIEKLLDICEVLETSVNVLFDRRPPKAPEGNRLIDLTELHAELNVGRFEVILRPLPKNKKRTKGGRS